MNFNFLTGDVNWKDYGGKFVSDKQDSGEFKYWLVIDVVNMDDATGDTSDGEYMVSLCVVAPSQCPQVVEKEKAGYGIEGDVDELMAVEIVSSYGATATVWHDLGDDVDELMAEAKRQAELCSMLFGFYMDRPQNRLGSTGWNFLAGVL